MINQDKRHKLMIKMCLRTKMKYLCKTSSLLKDPFEYKGSGKRWLNHIKKYNSTVITCIIDSFDTKEELKRAGQYYSKKIDIVKSDNWANLTEEKGDGGLIGFGQLGKRWKVKDTFNFRNKKTRTKNVLDGYKRISGRNNYQITHIIKTPCGTFDTKSDTLSAARELRNKNPKCLVTTDWGTLNRYLRNLDRNLPTESKRTLKEWRGKTPREIGFDLIEIENKAGSK